MKTLLSTRPVSRTAALLAGGLLACGCAVGPDYREPALDPPDTWHQALVQGLSTGEADLATWWKVLDDPILDGLIERATAGSLDLRAAVDRIDQARAARGIAVGAGLPSLDADAVYSYSKDSEEVVGPIPDNPRNFYSTALGAGWEVDLFGRIRRSVESAEATLEASVEDYRDVLVVLYAQIATNYADVRTLQERIRYAEQNIDLQRQTLELVRVRNRVGLVGDLDLRQAELNLSRTKSFVPQLRAALVVALNRIAVLIGGYPEGLDAALREPGPLPNGDVEVALGPPANLLRQRPDVRRAERALAAQTAQIGVATADLYPRLALLGTISLSAISSASWFTGGAEAWGVGPQLRWNLFDGGRIRANIRAQEALTREALVGYEQTLLLAVEEVEDAIAAYAQERQRREELRRSAEAAAESVRLVGVLYRTGLVDFLNVLDSERSLFDEQDRLAGSEGQVVKNLVRIYSTLGGGWSPQP